MRSAQANSTRTDTLLVNNPCQCHHNQEHIRNMNAKVEESEIRLEQIPIHKHRTTLLGLGRQRESRARRQKSQLQRNSGSSACGGYYMAKNKNTYGRLNRIFGDQTSFNRQSPEIRSQSNSYSVNSGSNMNAHLQKMNGVVTQSASNIHKVRMGWDEERVGSVYGGKAVRNENVLPQESKSLWLLNMQIQSTLEPVGPNLLKEINKALQSSQIDSDNNFEKAYQDLYTCGFCGGLIMLKEGTCDNPESPRDMMVRPENKCANNMNTLYTLCNTVSKRKPQVYNRSSFSSCSMSPNKSGNFLKSSFASRAHPTSLNATPNMYRSRKQLKPITVSNVDSTYSLKLDQENVQGVSALKNLEKLLRLQSSQIKQTKAPNYCQHHFGRWSIGEKTISRKNLEIRDKVIDILIEMCDHFKQRQRTRHLAIIYMDVMLSDDFLFDREVDDSNFFDSDDDDPMSEKVLLKIDEYVLVSTCVLLASKFYEIDSNLIMIQEIQDFMKPYQRVLYDEVSRCEIHILSRFEWDLFKVIPLDFIQIFTQMGIVYNDDVIKVEGQDGKKVQKSIRELSDEEQENLIKSLLRTIEQIMDLVMIQLDIYSSYTQFEVALAVILYSRGMVGIKDEQHQIFMKVVCAGQKRPSRQVLDCKTKIQNLIKDDKKGEQSFISNEEKSQKNSFLFEANPNNSSTPCCEEDASPRPSRTSNLLKEKQLHLNSDQKQMVQEYKRKVKLSKQDSTLAFDNFHANLAISQVKKVSENEIKYREEEEQAPMISQDNSSIKETDSSHDLHEIQEEEKEREKKQVMRDKSQPLNFQKTVFTIQEEQKGQITKKKESRNYSRKNDIVVSSKTLTIGFGSGLKPKNETHYSSINQNKNQTKSRFHKQRLVPSQSSGFNNKRPSTSINERETVSSFTLKTNQKMTKGNQIGYNQRNELNSEIASEDSQQVTKFKHGISNVCLASKVHTGKNTANHTRMSTKIYELENLSLLSDSKHSKIAEKHLQPQLNTIQVEKTQCLQVNENINLNQNSDRKHQCRRLKSLRKTKNGQNSSQKKLSLKMNPMTEPHTDRTEQEKEELKQVLKTRYPKFMIDLNDDENQILQSKQEIVEKETIVEVEVKLRKNENKRDESQMSKSNSNQRQSCKQIYKSVDGKIQTQNMQGSKSFNSNSIRTSPTQDQSGKGTIETCQYNIGEGLKQKQSPIQFAQINDVETKKYTAVWERKKNSDGSQKGMKIENHLHGGKAHNQPVRGRIYSNDNNIAAQQQMQRISSAQLTQILQQQSNSSVVFGHGSSIQSSQSKTLIKQNTNIQRSTSKQYQLEKDQQKQMYLIQSYQNQGQKMKSNQQQLNNQYFKRNNSSMQSIDQTRSRYMGKSHLNQTNSTNCRSLRGLHVNSSRATLKNQQSKGSINSGRNNQMHPNKTPAGKGCASPQLIKSIAQAIKSPLNGKNKQSQQSTSRKVQSHTNQIPNKKTSFGLGYANKKIAHSGLCVKQQRLVNSVNKLVIEYSEDNNSSKKDLQVQKFSTDMKKPSCGKTALVENNAIRKLSIRLDEISQSNNNENSSSIIEESSGPQKSTTPTGFKQQIQLNSRNNSNAGVLSARNCYPSANKNEVDGLVRNKTTFGYHQIKGTKREVYPYGRTTSQQSKHLISSSRKPTAFNSKTRQLSKKTFKMGARPSHQTIDHPLSGIKTPENMQPQVHSQENSTSQHHQMASGNSYTSSNQSSNKFSKLFKNGTRQGHMKTQQMQKRMSTQEEKIPIANLKINQSKEKNQSRQLSSSQAHPMQLSQGACKPGSELGSKNSSRNDDNIIIECSNAFEEETLSMINCDQTLSSNQLRSYRISKVAQKNQRVSDLSNSIQNSSILGSIKGGATRFSGSQANHNKSSNISHAPFGLGSKRKQVEDQVEVHVIDQSQLQNNQKENTNQFQPYCDSQQYTDRSSNSNQYDLQIIEYNNIQVFKPSESILSNISCQEQMLDRGDRHKQRRSAWMRKSGKKKDNIVVNPSMINQINQ